MRKLTLSDHTQEMVDIAANQRHATYELLKKQYAMAVQARDEAKTRIRIDLGVAWQTRSFVGVMRGIWHTLFGPLPRLQVIPVIQSAGRDEIVWVTGAKGEEMVANFLERSLNDDWTLVHGYKNPSGEIDQILVGPSGVIAIEIKHINGLIHCDGDRWWRDKFDKYGNQVESGTPVADKRGRSPSRQLNESADRLQNTLDRNFGEGRVRRAVVLSHEMSKRGNMSEIKVDLVTTLADFKLRDFLGAEQSLGSNVIEAVLDVIQKDHLFHVRRFVARPKNT